MPRFFVAAGNIARGVAVISGADADHIRVLRLKIGDEIIVCDGDGSDHRCRIKRIEPGEVVSDVLSSDPSETEPSVRVTVLAGMPKGERADLIVQKCTELGASEIVFFLCRRCVARPEGKSIEKKLARFQRIAEEAAKQSGRGIIPRVSFADDIAGAIDAAIKTELPLLMYETGDGRIPIRQALSAAGKISSAAIMTGPEGGFEKFETELAEKCGMKLCSMGKRILRCETAPAAALAAVMYETDNL